MALHTATTERERAAMLAGLDVAVLSCEGEMGEMEMAHLGEELFRLVHRGLRRVVVDFSRVDHVDYRGLKPLASRARLLRGSGGDLKLCGLSPYLAAIFRAAGVEDEFALFRNVAEAKCAFAQAVVPALVRR